MAQLNPQEENQVRMSVRSAMSIAFIGLIFLLSFNVIKPFLVPIVWGIIIAVGVYPLHRRFTKFLGNRAKLSAILIALIGVAVIVVPSIIFTSTAVKNVSLTVKAIEDHELAVPPPDASVSEWPFIGKKTHEIWSEAANSLNETFDRFEPQIREVAPKLTKAASQAVIGILLFILSLLVAGVLLLYADAGKKATQRVFSAFLGSKGEAMTEISIATIRSVVQGVIGIALIQAVFLGLGMFVIKVPAPGILALLVLILAIVQLPTILIMLPVTIYVFSIADTGPAVIFAIWTLLWSVSDNVLKPLLLGKGVAIPMPVILIGAIGGMIMFGPVGLFVGSVLLALAYKIISILLED
ncbi:MAG: AI-2E family transporter [Bacteroides sp.]|nr:AI-2E family transporter [Bacteroides sp.]